MIENLTILIFGCTLGTLLGWRLCEEYNRRKMVEAVNCLINSDWLGPQILAARIHSDQESVGDLPHSPPHNIWAPPKRMPVWVELQYEFRRWRVPRLRRVK